jgi:predicted CXXCH cytochrome family protein
VKRMSKGQVRRIRLRAAVAYPSVTVALVAVVALALTSFGPSQATALAATIDPTPTATASPTVDPIPTATASSTVDPIPTATTLPGTVVSPTPGLGVSPGAAFSSHHVVARIAGPALPASYLPIDASVSDASQFQTFRVRFRLNNAGTDPMTATPQLEFSLAGANSFLVVPATPKLGQAFHMAGEWVPSGTGTTQGPLGEDIAVAGFRMGIEGGLAMTGHHSMGANPDQPITMPQGSYTEEEFTVATSVDAKYLTGYDFRITNGGAPLTTDVASISLGAPPVVHLSPGQRQGVPVVDPSTTSTVAAAYPLLTVAGTTSATVVPGVSSPSAALYPLAAGALSTVAPGSTTVKISDAGIKGSHSTMADQCSVCHRGHTAQGPNLLAQSSQSALCFACHDGSQSNSNVQAEYADPPANKPETREYFSHAAVAPTTSPKHTQSQLNEFGGLSNRHSECADCHNSHKVGTTGSTQTPNGWDASASGPLAGVSGVSVVNGAANTTPAPAAFTFLDGVTKPITSEYQLCFKCHSSFTTLLPNIPGKPSTDALDKAAEFNPANASFHPVEAAGKNDTDAMKASLAGTSTYKLWNFNVGSTIRCLNCHASSTTPDTIPDPVDAAGAGGSLPPHTSGNRGILLRNYLDRQLKPAVDTASVKAAYSAGDFALCYVCHGEAPFVDSSSNATNFNLHAKHLTALGVGAGGTDIDKAGDGQGNAICAECHFRIHSTTNKVGSQVIPGSRLVNFAPNVEPFVPESAPTGTTGTLSWTAGATSGGTCTLTCHGQPHDGYKYN